MSRSGYSEDLETWELIRWRGAVSAFMDVGQEIKLRVLPPYTVTDDLRYASLQRFVDSLPPSAEIDRRYDASAPPDAAQSGAGGGV